MSLRAAYRGVTIDNMSKRAFTSLKSLIDGFIAAEESVGALFHDTVISRTHTGHNYNGRHSEITYFVDTFMAGVRHNYRISVCFIGYLCSLVITLVGVYNAC